MDDVLKQGALNI